MTHWALVTGGSRNIGAAIAKRLRSDGFKVLVSSRTPPVHDAFDEFVAADFTDPAAAAKAISEAIGDRLFTRFVHCAGLAIMRPGEDLPLSELNDVLAVNTTSFICLTQLLTPIMRRAQIGRIVAIGSRASLGKEGRLAYSTSKAALTGLTRTWALELGAAGITINVVAPGPIKTEMYEIHNPIGSYGRKLLSAGIPVGFVGLPEDVANAVSFFMADGSRYVTGQTLFVCGGSSIAFSDPNRSSVRHLLSDAYPEVA
jgi:3-oxoacyl-[acyl-carrier protein] reductase